MDEHALALVQWAGPTVLTVFGVAICLGLRAVFHSFEKILKRNDSEHQELFSRLRQQESRMTESDLKHDASCKKHEELIQHELRQDALLHEQGERLTRVEIKVESAQEDLVRIKGQASGKQ